MTAPFLSRHAAMAGLANMAAAISPTETSLLIWSMALPFRLLVHAEASLRSDIVLARPDGNLQVVAINRYAFSAMGTHFVGLWANRA
jgi:hypothetical protein